MPTTLPQLLFDRYKSYKDDTDKFTQWLATTATSLGYKIQPLPAQETPTPPEQPESNSKVPKSKGKPRKDTAKGPQTQTLPVKEFRSMAEFLSLQKPAVKVPKSILTLIRRAIAARKRCAQFFHQSVDRTSTDVESDQMHWHFIEMLEDVEKILSPFQDPPPNKESTPPPSGTSTPTKTKKSSPSLTAPNPYAPLPAEVIDDYIPTSSPTPKHTKSRPKPTKEEIHYAFICDAFECFFLLYSFIEDLHSIRDYIINVWKKYRARKIDLISTSLITNVAIEIVHTMQEQTLTNGVMWVDLDCYPMYVYHMQELWEILGMNGDVEDRAALESKSFKELMFFSAGIPLHRYLDDDGRMEVDYKGVCGRKKKWRDMTGEEKTRAEEELLLVVLRELESEWLGMEGNARHDQLTRELLYVLEEDDVTTSAVFAARIFLDIHQVLDEDVDMPFEDLGRTTTALLRALFQRPEKNPPVGWSMKMGSDPSWEERYNLFKETLMEMGKFEREIRGKTQVQLFEEGKMLYRWHPMSRGLVAFTMQCNADIHGRIIAEYWNTIFYSCYLYQACTILSKETDTPSTTPFPIWPDMEFVIKAHGAHRMFRGPLPKTLFELWKRMKEATGHSALEFIPAERRRKTKGGKVGKVTRRRTRPSPILSDTSPVFFDLFQRQMAVVNRGVYAMFIDFDVDRVVAGTEERARGGGGGESNRPSSFSTISSSTTTTEDPTTTLQKEWSQHLPQSPLHLLSSLLSVFTHDAKHHISFDYFSFHSRCLSLLQSLATDAEMDAMWTRSFGPTYKEKLGVGDDWDAYVMVEWILGSAAENPEQDGPAREGLERGYGVSLERAMRALRVPLEMAGRVLKEVIEKEGGVEVGKQEAGGWMGIVYGGKDGGGKEDRSAIRATFKNQGLTPVEKK
ncbi:hypothetical protein HDV00_002206 [Rhizophlyctis rosea]|nr:hypothetical protein HDV00_002206 [Rhizophlyctis rosea]